jgi:hypothetical protein
MQIRNDSQKPSTARLVAAVGDDFESATAAAVYHARLIMRDNETANGETQRKLEVAKEGISQQWIENWFDGLAYCKLLSLLLYASFECAFLEKIR